MATMREKGNIQEQRSVMSFLLAKGLNAKDIHKEIFPDYGGKCLSRNAIHNWVEKRGKCSLITKCLKRRCGSG
jgi:predicted oxidoreductase